MQLNKQGSKVRFLPLSSKEELIGKAIVNAAYQVHKNLGPGLLEKIYEVCMAYELEKAGFYVKRQVHLPIFYEDMIFEEGLVLDMLVNDLVIIELKAVDNMHPVWTSQIISHLKLANLNLGYLVNFNVPIIGSGISRYRK